MTFGYVREVKVIAYDYDGKSKYQMNMEFEKPIELILDRPDMENWLFKNMKSKINFPWGQF